jgi:hypothetical protein
VPAVVPIRDGKEALAVLMGFASPARLDGDLQALDEAVSLFPAEAPAWRGSIRDALDQGRVRDLEHAAHSLQGDSTSPVGPEAAAARRLEAVACAGDPAGTAGHFADLVEKMERLQMLLGREAQA